MSFYLTKRVSCRDGATLVHPGVVFVEVVRQPSWAHNHPSDNLEPSEDRDVTRRLRPAGDIIGIKVLDHLVFSEEGYFSMLEGNVF